MTLAADGLANAKAYKFTYADATARGASTGFVTADVGALALQLSDSTMWLLTATTPTWVQIGSTAGATPALVQIAETILGADAATIDFTSIPGTYRHLRVELVGRTDDTAGFTDVRVQLNGDTASNYDTEAVTITGTTTPAPFQNIGVGYMHCGWVAGDGAPANVPGSIALDCLDYARTNWHKILNFKGNVKTANSAGNLFFMHGTHWWRSTAAVTGLTLLLGNPAWKYKAGTVATLYGVN